MALDTMAASTSVGIAIGSAAVMAAGAATALTQGIKQGVENTSADRSQVSPDISIVDSRRPGSLANSTVDARRRVANVLEDLDPAMAVNLAPAVMNFCFKCKYGKGRHTYSNGCTGMPFSVYSRQPQRAPIQSEPSSSAVGQQTVPVVLPPPSLPPQQPVESPDDHLNRLLAERAAGISQPIPNTPGGTGVLHPPDSFGSAHSQGLRSELVSCNNTQVLLHVVDPPVGSDSFDASQMAQLQDQLREVIASNLELTNAVDSLQREVKCLEIRVEDLHLQMQNVNQEPECWDIHTPCSNQNEPDELHDCYDDQDAQVETSESAPPLPATSETGILKEVR